MAKKSRLEFSGGEKGEGVRWMGILEVFGMQTVVSGMNGQWDPTIQHRGMCVIGSFHCTTELEQTL